MSFRIRPCSFGFQPVEAFAIDTDDRALRHKCIGVYLFHQLEDFIGLTLVSQYYQYFDMILAIPASTIQYRHTAVRLAGDAVGYFFVKIRNCTDWRALFTM